MMIVMELVKYSKIIILIIIMVNMVVHYISHLKIKIQMKLLLFLLILQEIYLDLIEPFMEELYILRIIRKLN